MGCGDIQELFLVRVLFQVRTEKKFSQRGGGGGGGGGARAGAGAGGPDAGTMGQGILFDKGFGQHILKNPLVVQAIVEKVRNFDFLQI